MAVLENYNITAKALNKDEEEERWGILPGQDHINIIIILNF
jgi:hypothetical protein